MQDGVPGDAGPEAVPFRRERPHVAIQKSHGKSEKNEKSERLRARISLEASHEENHVLSMI